MENKSGIEVFDYYQNKLIREKVPVEKLLKFLYQNDTYSASVLRDILSKNALFSKLIGAWMRLPWTKKNIAAFIKEHDLKEEEFAKSSFSSFNDFFIRKLKADARPIAENSAIVPSDGRHIFYEDLSKQNSFFVKGQTLNLEKLLNDTNLASLYKNGSMIISRLAPADYHRFHFPVDACVKDITTVNGSLYSVSPIALKEMIQILHENKRMLVTLVSKAYGNVLQVLVGATNVGSIHLTAEKNKTYKKGDELGYFSFGGSMVITLFQKEAIAFDPLFLKNTESQTETYLQVGTRIEKEH